MPELLTKHPDVAIQVLKSQGAQCGSAVKPKILTRCPQEKFCTLQGGELCVYGASELDQMTQLTRSEICGPAPPRAAVAPAGPVAVVSVVLAAAIVAIVVGRVRRRH